MTSWEKCKLGDVCNTISETYKGDSQEVVLINTSDVLAGKCLNHSKTRNKDLKGQFKKTFQKNDILYSEIRPANKRFAYIDFTPTNYIASTKLMVIRSNGNINSEYLYYILQSKSIVEELQMLAESRSGTFPQITFVELANLSIILPPLDCQIQIVNFLKSIDSKIELNRQINDNLEQQAQALYKSWFVNFEPFKDGKFMDSELGMIPESWRVISFASFIIHSSEKTENIIVPEYSVTNEGIFPRAEKYNKQLSSSSTKNKIVRKGDLVFGMSREILNWGIMADAIGGVSSAYTVYNCIYNGFDQEYLRNYLNNHIDYFKDLIKPAAREGQGIDKAMLMNKSIIIPSNKVIASFNAKYYSLMEQIDNYRQQICILSNQRDVILPKLMSGKIKINELDC